MTKFQTVTDTDLTKAILFNRSRLHESGCWVWARTKRAGYGLMQHGKRTTSAHRVSYEVFKGSIPRGMVVRHACDNPSCINPDHLSLGTQADNMRDRTARGRGHKLKGEQIGTSKLTVAQVREIKSSVGRSLAELAKQYGVDKSSIGFIRAGKAWKHVIADDAADKEPSDAR